MRSAHIVPTECTYYTHVEGDSSGELFVVLLMLYSVLWLSIRVEHPTLLADHMTNSPLTHVLKGARERKGGRKMSSKAIKGKKIYSDGV